MPITQAAARTEKRCELLEHLAGKRPTRVIVIDTFRCGHAMAFNTWVDANGQRRCVMCRQARRKAAMTMRQSVKKTAERDAVRDA